jgi:hypothetical protein
MTLTIRDEEIESMAERLRAATNAGSVEDVVRQALQNEMAKYQAEPKLKTEGEIRAVIQAARQRAIAEGRNKVRFDMKAFSDELWGDV